MDSDGTRKTDDGSATKGTAGEKGLDLDVSLSGQTCDVCYDLLQYPVNLPCSHIFCFLCIKGAYFNNKLCPMCRAPIPDHIIKRPQVKTSSKSSNSTVANSSRSSRSNSLRSSSKKQSRVNWQIRAAARRGAARQAARRGVAARYRGDMKFNTGKFSKKMSKNQYFWSFFDR